MLSTIIGFALSLSPIAMEAPEDNISQEINNRVDRIVGRDASIRILGRDVGVRIDANKETMLIIGNKEKLKDNH